MPRAISPPISTMKRSPRFVLITGLSGAGKSHVLRLFEDRGYYCVDNLPAALVPTFAKLVADAESPHSRVAVCVDARTGEDLVNLPAYLDRVAALGFRLETLYLETSDEVLHRRYSESRRPHPSSPTGSIDQGIRAERALLDPIREHADVVIDTSATTTADLGERIESLVFKDDDKAGMTIGVVSFGYKHGLPKEADMVLDVRFLPNPHYEPGLRSRDGREEAVRKYVLENETAEEFMEHVRSTLAFLIPQYEREPKSYLTIAVGCTGGRHRSVAVAQRIAQELREMHYDVTLRHRDLDTEA